MDRGALRRTEARWIIAGALRYRRTPYPERGVPPPPGGLPAVCTRAHWQRCRHPAPARYLWRVNGCSLSLYKYGEPISHDLWMNLTRLLNWVCDHWHCKDYGI